jgi:hypothetical protein
MARKPCSETPSLFLSLHTQMAPVRLTRPERRRERRPPAPLELTSSSRLTLSDRAGAVRCGEHIVGGWIRRPDGRFTAYGGGRKGTFPDKREAELAAYRWAKKRKTREGCRQ